VRVLVLGIGNSLLTDDGVGVHAALRLAAALGDSPDVTVLDAGTQSFSLFHYVECADALIALDAARDGRAPGELVLREGADFDRFVRRAGRSVHEVGLADLLDMARLGGRLPAHRVLIGIEPAATGWGLECTPAVEQAIPAAVNAALDHIHRWRARPSAGAPALCVRERLDAA
jgi:hydrogenase maturation protease